MLEVLRFWFTKDLVCFGCSDSSDYLLILLQKYVKGKPCKPYNSTLGEFFRVSTSCLRHFIHGGSLLTPSSAAGMLATISPRKKTSPASNQAPMAPPP
jgi:hypothetical protein